MAFITGASSGIGEAVARRFAREGAKVAVVASSDLSKAEAVVRSIESEGGKAWACTCDVRRRASVDEALLGVKQALGPVDIVVNAAGVYFATPIGKTPEEEVDRMIDINLKGTFNVINAIAPSMQKAGHGKIINFASVAARLGVRERSLYCATKAAVAQMTRALAREFAPCNVNINAIAPGNTATPMNAKVRNDPSYAQQLAGMVAATPSRTAYSDPADMASVALFLASEDSKVMHGAMVIADEGISTGLG
ncbi:MAG TPA: SDR family oxidoreductase [Steroidobacteraceae bacterium]|nr:SDR family oxidoreductase [Steroidobacteraceae bacterium]